MAEPLNPGKGLRGGSPPQAGRKVDGKTVQLCQDLKVQIKQFMGMLEGLKKTKDMQVVGPAEQVMPDKPVSTGFQGAESIFRTEVKTARPQPASDAGKGAASWTWPSKRGEGDAGTAAQNFRGDSGGLWTGSSDSDAPPQVTTPELTDQNPSTKRSDEQQSGGSAEQLQLCWGVSSHGSQPGTAGVAGARGMAAESQPFAWGEFKWPAPEVKPACFRAEAASSEPVPSVRQRLKAKRQSMTSSKDRIKSQFGIQQPPTRYLSMQKGGSSLGLSQEGLCDIDETDSAESTDTTGVVDFKVPTVQPASPSGPITAHWSTLEDPEVKSSWGATATRRVHAAYDDDEGSSVLTTISEGEEEEECDVGEDVATGGDGKQGSALAGSYMDTVPLTGGRDFGANPLNSASTAASAEQDYGDKTFRHRRQPSIGGTSDYSYSGLTEMSEMQERRLLESLVRRLKAENKRHRTELGNLKDKMSENSAALQAQITGLQGQLEAYKCAAEAPAERDSDVGMKGLPGAVSTEGKPHGNEQGNATEGEQVVENASGDPSCSGEEEGEVQSLQLGSDHVALLKKTINEQGKELETMEHEIADLNGSMNAILSEKQTMDVKMAEMCDENLRLKEELKKATSEVASILKGMNSLERSDVGVPEAGEGVSRAMLPGETSEAEKRVESHLARTDDRQPADVDVDSALGVSGARVSWWCSAMGLLGLHSVCAAGILGGSLGHLSDAAGTGLA